MKRTVLLTYINDDHTVISTKFIAPEATFKIHDKPVISIDVTDGGLGLSASLDNNLYIWQCKNGEIRVKQKSLKTYKNPL